MIKAYRGRLRRFNSQILAILASCLALSSCLTIGRPFDDSRVRSIQIGKTTQAEIKKIFGRPFRTGLEDSDPTWTYLHYKLNVFGEQRTMDLYVRFDPNGAVKSYSFNTNFGSK